ncbi:hypothetical protein Pla123a_04240 [Posidoniimonas polymericola]|uniref:DUF2617 domain-containing protein n=1 Tax=Posidoniimonas polymericola TaxID=2528002 RepID=A0A5C5ZEZ2_9BACT|nr:DUF2617 family protein [Posidoniimonas polymericola]TWT85617.1 hypothetical protein Pla123a_04240 [Posidoniimonas polymericola]
MLSTRPKIAELTFQLYGRTLHPELFQTYKSRTVKRGKPGSKPADGSGSGSASEPGGGYEAKLSITSAGHAIEWRYDGLVLTEIATSAQDLLPERRRLMCHSLRGEQNDQVECRGGVTYRVNFSLESVDAKAFYTFQNEIMLAGAKEGMLHQFDSSGRFGLGALSYVNVQSRDRSMLVQALHTFPDDYAIVKTQSVFKLP